MSKIKILTGILIPLLLLSSSCSISDKVTTGKYIQKRKYNKGFYVNINNKKDKLQNIEDYKIKHKKETDISLKTKIDVPDKTEVIIDNSLIASTDNNFTTIINDYPETYASFDMKLKNSFVNKVKSKKKIHKLNLSQPNDDSDPKIELFGLIGFIYSILVGVLFLFIRFSGLLSIVFGIISLIRINNNPDRLKGKVFAILSIILGAIELGTLQYIIIYSMFLA